MCTYALMARDFDKILLRRLAEHFYEDEVSNLPSVPDVCNYLVSEDASFVPNGNTNAPMTEGITGPEVAPRLSQQDNRSVDPKSERSLPSVLTASIYGPSSFRSVVPSEKPSILGPVQGPEMSNKQRAGYNPPSHGTANSFSSGSQPPVSEARGDEAVHGYGLQKKNLPQAGQLSGIQGTINRLFVYEVMFTGKKIGTGMGKTRKDAQQPATENPFCSLADKYAAYVISRSETGNKEPDNQSSDMENGFLWDSDSDESLVKDVDKSSEVEEFSTQVASPVLKDGKEIEASDEYIKVQLADPVHYWTLVEFDLVHDWTPVESKNSFLNYWEKEVNILPGDLKHGAGTIGKIGIEHDKNHFSIDDCSFEAITEPFKVKDLRNELTMLGYCPVSVLPSNTAIAPVNPTFSHRENYKDTYKPSLQDLILTTENFAHVNCIGKGGFGRVYKGEHANVRGNRSRGKGDTEFYSELQILSKYKHENAMSLVGYITETDEKFIVYEHASRESLDKYLNDVSPTWNNRLKICINFATRLDFLHGRLYWRKTIIHRYIKAANIIPPGDLKAKIGTLGLSMESTINQEKDYATDHVCGTRGYVDLMYFKSDYLTRESDVILFDILCGRSMYAIYHEKGQYLPSKRNWTEMTLLSFVDRDGDQEGKDRDRGRERNDRERDSNCYAKPVKNIAESAARKLWVEIMLGEGGLKKVDYLNFSKTNRTEMTLLSFIGCRNLQVKG